MANRSENSKAKALGCRNEAVFGKLLAKRASLCGLQCSLRASNTKEQTNMLPNMSVVAEAISFVCRREYPSGNRLFFVGTDCT